MASEKEIYVGGDVAQHTILYYTYLATERERHLTTARAAKIPARNWVDNAVAFRLKCDLA